MAWFIVRQELARVDAEDVAKLLKEVEAEVKPQLMPFYACDGPGGEKGTWRHLETGKLMGENFDPLTVRPEERKNYEYAGPEQIYTFWAKHGSCVASECGHFTPILKSPVLAEKSITVPYFENTCSFCTKDFHVEEKWCRMAPDVPLVVSEHESKFVVIGENSTSVSCPHCKAKQNISFRRKRKKKVSMKLLIHPDWIRGLPKRGKCGEHGGSFADSVEKVSLWVNERAGSLKLLEVRGEMPDRIECPETGVEFYSGAKGGTVPKKSTFICQADGRLNDVLASVKNLGKNGPFAAYAVQAFSSQRKHDKMPYSGRFFLPFDQRLAKQYNAALAEWDKRKDSDLRGYWPESELPYGLMTHHKNGSLPAHGITHWKYFFNPRQLLSLSLILKNIMEVGTHSNHTREFVLGAFQNFIRNQSLMSIWDIKLDTMSPALANSNFHPKNNVIEVASFGPMGRGPWPSTTKVLENATDWYSDPWELLSTKFLEEKGLTAALKGKEKSIKVYPGDALSKVDFDEYKQLRNSTATNLSTYPDESIDLVVTDPPFGGLLHYSELSDFFYVWLKLVLKNVYPDSFGTEFSPKALEVVANEAREPEDSQGFYRRLLTVSWKESFRILKKGGMLVFTFHHSEDAPWVDVLESLFNAGFYLVSTYPVRSDETKGAGQFGSKTIEYDIIHVCRKRIAPPRKVSWARLRKQILADVRQLTKMIELHEQAGVSRADIEVIQRGKALEYYSKHYGEVYVDSDHKLTVREALIGVNQIIAEDFYSPESVPPAAAKPVTRQFLRIFDSRSSVSRDEMHKLLRGSGLTPDEFKSKGWCREVKREFIMIDPQDYANEWQGKHKRNLTVDIEQAFVIIGACTDGSGINALETIKNVNFKPQPALEQILVWFTNRGATKKIKEAAKRGSSIYLNWASQNKREAEQLSLYQEENQGG